MSPADPPPAIPFSDQLEQWLGADGPKSIGDLGQVFAEKSFAVTILFLMFIPALPLPTGGVTHVFEVITVILAGQMVLGVHTIWLPNRWRNRELGARTVEKALPFMVKRVRWFERFSRPRLATLLNERWFLSLLGLVIIALAIAAAVAPPFSGLDTLPSLGAVVVALGIILDDMVVVGIGVLIGTGGVVLIVTVGAALFRVVTGLF
jgi:hypothetical protein